VASSCPVVLQAETAAVSLRRRASPTVSTQYDRTVPALLVKEGPLSGRRLEIDEPVVLGRGEADVVIGDAEMSRRHALLRVSGEQIEIEDLDSLNGTWVNGERIDDPVRLRPGDLVRVGSSVLEVEAAPLARSVLPVVEPRAVPVAAPPSTPPDALLAPAPSSAPGRCPECGADVSSSSRFCSYCGVALAASPTGPASSAVERGRSGDLGFPVVAAMDDELRPVTALFADVVGSTSLGERLAPQEVKALIGECVTRMSRVIEQFGGTVKSFMGDGIAAFFGMPVAHEDDPDRAAHAALGILEVVADYAADILAAWGVADFNVRVGINSGQTAVGVVGAADRQVVAIGDAANVAARLQTAAAPGTIVVGESTARRLAHRFVLESLGEIRVKGREQAVSAWRLAGRLADARAHAPTPLVGREDEAARLRATLDDLASGRGQLLLLVGDAGIGKTRMLSELETIAGTRALWLQGNARAFGGELLYWPFAEVLRRWLAVEPGEAEVAVRTKLRAKLATLDGLDTDDAVAKLGALLGLKVGTSDAPQLRPDELAHELRVAYAAWIAALCARRPVVLAIDDLQWVDAPTRELAESLLEVTDRAPLLLTVAFRTDVPSEATRFRLHALEHYPHRTSELALRPLSAEAAEELLAMLMPDGVDAAAGNEVISRAEGNPLYLEELLRALIEEGGIERRRRTWALTRTPAQQVPPALEGLLMSRIDNLSEGPRRLAQVAAVVGRSFPVRVLERVAPSADFDRDLSILLRAQVITEMRRYPELVYSFKHGLLQESSISTLTPARREELYGEVAAVFEDLYAGAREEYLGVLASYYARSRNRAKALEYLELAGARAASLNANAEAAAMLRRALNAAEELGDKAARQRIGGELDRLGTADVGTP
jgi:class 3 adenylate cyclase